MIAKIAVSAATFAIDKTYSYRIPSDMELRPGQRVQLPFGRGNRRCEGVVLSLEAGDESKLKCVERVLDENPILTRNQLLLAAFIRERYFCTLYDAIRAMLPAGLWFQTKASYVLTEDRSWEDASIKKAGAAELLRLMDSLGGQAEEPALRTCIADEEILEGALTYLVKKKWVEARTEFQRRSNDKTEKIVTLAASPEEAMAYAAARPKSALQQKAVLELLCSLGSVAAKEICYFTGAKMPTLQSLEKKGYVTLSERPVLRCREIKPAQIQRPLVLNEAQAVALLVLKIKWRAPSRGLPCCMA
jgi:primosomal protein N' (replication factor Y)